MPYTVDFGSNIFRGTDGVLSVESGGKVTDFLKIRELDAARSTDTFVAVDCDIKDAAGRREIKLAKSRPVVVSDEIEVVCESDFTTVKDKDERLVISIQRIRNGSHTLLKIRGDFVVGGRRVTATDAELNIDGSTMSSNIFLNTGGLVISDRGISCG